MAVTTREVDEFCYLVPESKECNAIEIVHLIEGDNVELRLSGWHITTLTKDSPRFTFQAPVPKIAIIHTPFVLIGKGKVEVVECNTNTYLDLNTNNVQYRTIGPLPFKEGDCWYKVMAKRGSAKVSGL